MQLLARFDTKSYDTWKTAYEGAAEDRGQAGLTQLQLWTDAASPSTIWGLYDVSDQGKAREHLETRAKLDDATSAVELHFLKRA